MQDLQAFSKSKMTSCIKILSQDTKEEEKQDALINLSDTLIQRALVQATKRISKIN